MRFGSQRVLRKLKLRACLNPPSESIGTNRMEYVLSHESVLIGHGKRKRISTAREKQYILEEGGEMLHPFFFFGRTERPDRTGTNSISFDVDGHHRRWAWTPNCAQQRVGVVACAKYAVHTDSAGEAQNSAWTNPRFFRVGTERMPTSSLVPFRAFPWSLEGVQIP